MRLLLESICQRRSKHRDPRSQPWCCACSCCWPAQAWSFPCTARIRTSHGSVDDITTGFDSPYNLGDALIGGSTGIASRRTDMKQIRHKIQPFMSHIGQLFGTYSPRILQPRLHAADYIAQVTHGTNCSRAWSSDHAIWWLKIICQHFILTIYEMKKTNKLSTMCHPFFSQDVACLDVFSGHGALSSAYRLRPRFRWCILLAVTGNHNLCF